jgi:mRNA-degrading endonuclease YafQ of YafQ-DinJ toxin-antitoxin module
MREDYVYAIFPSAKFKRTRKLAKKQGLDMDLLDWAVDQLARDIPLPSSWKDHQLKGNMKLCGSKAYAPSFLTTGMQMSHTLPVSDMPRSSYSS